VTPDGPAEHSHVGRGPDDPFANDHEEVYLLIEGAVTVEIDGEVRRTTQHPPGESLGAAGP
jgi:hypothetical protein